MTSRTLAASAAALIAVLGVGAAAQDSRAARKALKGRADAVIKLESVERRDSVGKILEYVDALDDRADAKEKLKYLMEALRADAWKLDRQLQCARLMKAAGDAKGAREKAELVATYAEDDSMVAEARGLLGPEPSPEPRSFMTAAAGTAPIVLGALGDASWLVVEEVRAGLEKELGCGVAAGRLEFTPPKPKHDRLAEFAKMQRRLLEQQLRTDPDLRARLKKQGLEKPDFDDVEDLIKVLEATQSESPRSAFIVDGQDFLKEMKDQRFQWDAIEVLDEARRLAGNPAKGRAYVFVFPGDMTYRDANFVFGSAVAPLAVLSTRRFTARFNDEPPRRERLVQRTLKQALASAGHALEVERCTNPVCARAYPNSLVEHDAKEAKICSACRDGFKKALAR